MNPYGSFDPSLALRTSQWEGAPWGATNDPRTTWDARSQSQQADVGASSAAGPAGTAAPINSVAQIWLDLYKDRLQRMTQTLDPGLKQHFQSELDVMKPTLRAMGLPIPGESGSVQAPSRSSGGSQTNEPRSVPANANNGVNANKPRGGVHANAISGVNPNSVRVVRTGTGTDKVYNLKNSSRHEESFTYSVNGVNKGTITLAPGQTGSFVAGSADMGVRITPSDRNGHTKPNEVLYEDGGASNGQRAGVCNPDISKVDGNKDFYGNALNMTVTLSNGRRAGDGEAIRAYRHPTDDAAAMGLAGDSSKTANIVVSDA